MSDSLQPCGLQHARHPCPLLFPRVCSNACPLSWCCHQPSHLLLPLSLSTLNLFQHQDFFPVSQLYVSGSQRIGASASASVLPMNIQGWFPLGLTDLISLLSIVSSSPTVWKHQLFGAQPSLWSNSQSVHDYWKNHSFDYMNLCWQSDVFAFKYDL